VRYLVGRDKAKIQYENENIIILTPVNRVRKLPQETLLPNGEKFFAGDAFIASILYHFMVSPISGKSRSATTGFNQVLKIILSGLCKKVDIYGMSANCGGYYHKRQVNMKVQHSCELESWALHHIMRNFHDTLHTCVYI
jgi:hypothetical protein